MAKDVVPELMEAIGKAFTIHTENDRTLSRVTKRIRDGTATQEDGHIYAIRIGKDSSRALRDVLTEDNLPDGKLYYNIATRTVIPTLENNQALVNDAASQIQKSQDARQKLKLNPVRPSFPRERVDGLIDKMTADDIELEQALVWIDEPIVNNTEAFYDDFIRENAEFRSGAGLKTIITRIAEANCCQWCADLEGTYEYGKEPPEVYARHEFCRCTVTYQSERTSQNVWTKKTWQSTPEEIARRENIGKQPQILPKDRLATIQQGQTDTQEKARDLLYEAYEKNRTLNNLELSSADELKEINFEGIGADFDPKKIAPEVAEAFNDSLADINGKYITTVTNVKPMTAQDAINFPKVYARSYHDYAGTNKSEIEYNPLKVNNANKLREKISEFKKSGYIPNIDDENLLKYVSTHELGHTIIDMQTPLPKSNWAQADYSNVKAARKEIASLFDEYTKNHADLEALVKDKLTNFTSLDDKGLEEFAKLEQAFAASSISKYSFVNTDEFIAEAYTDSMLSKNPNEWSIKLTTILDKYFGI